MSAYRAYIRVEAGDDGKPLGKARLQPVVDNLNAHAKARAEDTGWPIRFNPFAVRSHLNRPTIVMEVYEAWQVRVAYKAARVFLDNTGWRAIWYVNANTRKAI